MPTVCELVVSALVLLSSVAIQTCGQEDHAIPSLPLITFPVLNRCTDNVQSQFVVPETLKYRHYSAQKLNLLTKVINAPLFEFELRLKELPCKIDTFSVTVFIANNGTSCSGKNVFLNFTADGSINRLVISDDNDYLEEIIYHKDNFCISSISKDFISLNFCKSKCYLNDDEAGQNICVPRCCASGSISSGEGKNVIGCVSTVGSEWIPEIFSTERSVEAESQVNVQLVVQDAYANQYWNCTGKQYTQRILDTSGFRILQDGRIMLKKQFSRGDEWEEILSGEMPYKFCVDGYWDRLKSDNYEIDSSILLRQCEPKETSNQRAKFPPRKEVGVVWKPKYIIFLVHIPCAFIYFVVLVIYLSIWDKHRVHGWTVVGLVSSQFLVYILLIFIIWSLVPEDVVFAANNLDGICAIFGILHHFFSISVYSWTVVLTFDVWSTLSSIRPQSSRSMGRLLTAYTGFGFGVPTVIVFIVAAILQLVPQMKNVVIPGYNKSCVVSGGKPYLLYVSMINTALYIINLVFAGLTLKSLWAASKMASKLTTSRKESSRNKTALMSRLGFVMGFCLVFDFILNFGELTKYSQYFSFLEVHRFAQSMGLFWTFVCGAKTQEHIRDKFPEFHKIIFSWIPKSATERRPSSGSNTTTRSSSKFFNVKI